MHFGLSYLNLEILPILFSLSDINRLKPNYIFGDFRSIDILFLKKRQIKSLIIDLDQTLCINNAKEIYLPFQEKYYSLRKEFNLCILSNAPRSINELESSQRFDYIETKYSVKVIRSKRKKPNKEGFIMALNYLNTPPNQTAMIGDRLFTDILGANQCSIISILVKPISQENDATKLISIIRSLENKIIRHKKWGKNER